MCLLSIFPPGIQPVREHLENGARLNPHGFGFALQAEGGLEIRHDLEAGWEIPLFANFREDYPDGWAMFHSRHSADGPGLIENCQPLLLPDGGVLAHNGGLFPVKDDVSDTRVFVDEMLPNWDLSKDSQVAMLEARLGRNKIAILSREGAPLILNAELGLTLPDGTWHSNEDFTGAFHLRAGQCGACHRRLPGLPEVSRCGTCTEAAFGRRALLVRP